MKTVSNSVQKSEAATLESQYSFTCPRPYLLLVLPEFSCLHGYHYCQCIHLSKDTNIGVEWLLIQALEEIDQKVVFCLLWYCSR